MFVLATRLSDESGADARSREAAALATGSLHARLTLDGAPLFDADGRRVGAGCGVTFVSPSFAVTAAHCTVDTDSELPVEAYRPTLALNQGFAAASILSGTFPDYTHARLGPEHGYHVDRFTCRLFARCSFDSPGPCPQLGPDIALLECDGRPGDRYGFLDVAAFDSPDAEPFMPWKHEVYDLDQSPAQDLFARYTELPFDYADNYHYLALGVDGRELHQLLPLTSTRFAPDVPHQKVAFGEHVVTDLLGCHGTSGSGALQRSELGPWQLLGPATFGDIELGQYLCNHQPSLSGNRHGPGASGISYASLDQTHALLATAADRFREDCMAWPRGETTLFTHLACPREGLAADPENLALARALVPPRELAPLDVLGRWPIALDAEGALSMLGPELEQGQNYRVGLDVTVTQGCAGAACPRVSIYLNETQLLTIDSFTHDGQRLEVRAAVTARATGRAALLFEVQGGSAELDALSVVPVEHVLDFDRASQRWQAVLLDPLEAAGAAMARFVGDGAEGFEVRLLPAERLLMPFLALSLDGGLSASFSVRGASALRCGLLDATLTPVLTADCSGGTLRLPAAAAALSGPATALFIENLGSEEVLIDRLAVASPPRAAPTPNVDAGAPPPFDAGDSVSRDAAPEGAAADEASPPAPRSDDAGTGVSG